MGKYFSLLLLIITVNILRVSSTKLEGLKCTAEEVQLANSAQLYSILSELSESTFFRLVRVNLDLHDQDGCPVPSLAAKGVGGSATCQGDSMDPFAASFGSTMAPSGSLCAVESESTAAMELASTVVSRISAQERFAQSEFSFSNSDSDCETEKIRPDYWLDICDDSNARLGEYINLRLNPERNTGYDGSQVWHAIHEEVKSVEALFPEGKILGRIISGYHASVTTQIMNSFYPPAGAKGKEWEPNFLKFKQSVTEKNLENMQFAFVVLVRSLFKIKDVLYAYPFSTGNSEEDTQTVLLMRHLLDATVLSTCESVVNLGFDETQMFHPVVPGTSDAAKKFKSVYQKIAQIATHCVTCKRCRLHATVAMHGIGVAIKILLTPKDHLVISRDDIVALVNTVEQFSTSIEQSRVFKHQTVVAAPFQHLEFIKLVRDQLTRVEEDALVHAIISKDERISVLAQVFSEWAFIRHALIALGLLSATPDAIVIGGGLAGLVTAISVAERGASVIVIEKTKSAGGNSAKASSGINSVGSGDAAELESFLSDTIKSQNGRGDPELAKILIDQANSSVAWLQTTVGFNLSSVTQLGGHASPRTWKPDHGIVGAELMAGLVRTVKQTYSSQISLVTDAKVQSLIVDSQGTVVGVRYETAEGSVEVLGRSIVIASGGFGFDSDGLLKSHRPDLADFPTTLGSHTTGDGIRIATSVGADLLDMQHVQLHPTGFVDPKDPHNKVKVLAAEALRGVGGILLNKQGNRFVDELETRKNITDTMLLETEKIFWLILSDESAKKISQLLNIYLRRGLMREIHSIEEVEALIGGNLRSSLIASFPQNLSNKWYVGEVTPVVHYTMGGIKVDAAGRVLKHDGSPVPHLFAVGEVTGGVHGENRLGGNSLLECTVFGRIIGGSSIPVSQHLSPSHFSPSPATQTTAPITAESVRIHSTSEDCWTIISGKVYDLSRYASEHPGGVEAIVSSCGIDSTIRFLSAHSLTILSDMGFEPIGEISL